MSRFDAGFAVAGLPGLMFQHGQSAVYCPVDGPDVPLKMIVHPEARPVSDTKAGRTVGRMFRGTITDNPDNEDFGGVSQPTEAATVKYQDEIWAIQEVLREPGAWVLTLARSELSESNNSGLRGRV
jgi:hypothetical protein